MSLKAAKAYKKYGYSVIATDASKRPTVPKDVQEHGEWKPYQTNIATDTELSSMFASYKAKGLAVICGMVSGGLEVIDVDCKYDLTGNLFEDYFQAIMDESTELASKLLIAKTTNGGYHIYYRCDKIEGNKKLASRETTKEEKDDNPNDKVRVLIETRGQGGYVIAWPTPGYAFLDGKTPKDCPTITPEERDMLMEIARSLNQFHEKPAVHSSPDDRNYAVSPFEDYNKRGDIVGLLAKHGWTVVKDTAHKTIFKRPGNTQSKTSGDYNKDLGWFSVFTTSSQFEPNKAYRPYAVYAILECGGDFSRAAKQLLQDGYGRVRKRIDKKYEGYIRKALANENEEDSIVSSLKTHFDLTAEQAKAVYSDFKANSGERVRTFWDVDPEKMKVNIVRNKLERFLSDEGGFYLYFYDQASKIFKVIKDENGLIEEASTEQIKKFVKNYILSLPGSFDDITREDLLEVVYRGGGTYFSDQFFEFLEPANIDFLKDTADVAYFPFKNGVACVDKDGYEMKSYGDLKKSIWKSQVIDFNFEGVELESPNDVEFYQFIRKISNDDPARIKYCCAVLGYLMHKFKDPTTPYCVILAEETEDEKKGGGTGKGILIKGLSYLINTEQVDGKNFKLDKNFAFQRVKLDTKLVAIQDVRKSVDFEGFYSIITEGITIEKKNKDELYIPYSDSPKIIFTTNYTIPGNSNHARRRQKIIEFGSFFTPENTPLDHFGHRMFDDWDNDQWLKFYNFMFQCVMMYLKEGIPNIESSVSVKNKQTRLNFGEEFFSFWNDYSSNGCGNWKLFGDLYTQFLGENDMEKKEYSQKRFKKGFEETAALYGFKLNSRKNRQASNKVEVRMEVTGEIGCSTGEEEIPF